MASFVTYGEFWFLHIAHTLFKLSCPFSAKKFEQWRYFKVICAAEFTVAVVFGCLPFLIILLLNRFTMAQFPAFYCQADDVAIVFYAFILPLILLQITGTSAMIILTVVLYNVS